jgi:ElaB/YqjD/DUF883 family membrane-anchored ribosome-binding protein
MNQRSEESDQAVQSGDTATAQLRQSAHDVRENLRNIGGNVSDAAREQLGKLRDQASDYYGRGKQKAQEWEQNVEDFVHDRPVQALLIAAGVGMFLGLMWRRR